MNTHTLQKENKEDNIFFSTGGLVGLLFVLVHEHEESQADHFSSEHAIRIVRVDRLVGRLQHIRGESVVERLRFDVYVIVRCSEQKNLDVQGLSNLQQQEHILQRMYIARGIKKRYYFRSP